MNRQARVEDPRRATNPLFNDRKLKLGTFCTNLSGGCTMSKADGMLDADWASATALAKMADAMEFEAIVPVGRWMGFGGETDFNGRGFECFTFAAGMAALCRRHARVSRDNLSAGAAGRPQVRGRAVRIRSALS